MQMFLQIPLTPLMDLFGLTTPDLGHGISVFPLLGVFGLKIYKKPYKKRDRGEHVRGNIYCIVDPN